MLMETEEKKEPADNSEGNVRVLSRSEQILYDGVTIDGGEDPTAPKPASKTTWNTGNHFTFRAFNYTVRSDSLIAKIVLGLLAAGVVCFILFVALPVAFIVLGVLLIIWLILSFFQKR